MSDPLNRLRAATLALAVLVTACGERPLPPPVVVPAPSDASSDALRWAVESALAQRHLSVLARAPGQIIASVHSNGSGEWAKVSVMYGDGEVRIECLREDVDRGRYQRWMQLLSADIQKNVATIGMRAVQPQAAP
jgi:hypothetical protein